MDALTAAGLCALFIATPQCPPPAHLAAAPQLDHWQPLISQGAQRFHIPESWIAAVMKLESGGFTTFDGRPITSSAGAMGLMQLMPATYAELRTRYGLGPNPYDPHDSVFAGAAYLSELFKRYGYPNLFAAYHAGPGRLDAYLSGQKPLPKATIVYLESLNPGVENASFANDIPPSNPSKSTPDPLFFVRANIEIQSSDAANPSPRVNELFVPLGGGAR
jgi:soluble lytic murein transglycosylase-like protein